MSHRSVHAVLGVLFVLAACAVPPYEQNAVSAPAPTYVLGDRWTYRARDGFRDPLEWVETREVTAAGASGINVRVIQTGDTWTKTWLERWVSPGQVAFGAIGNDEPRRFDVPLERFNFPLTSGQSWNQWVGTLDEKTELPGQISRYVKVTGWDRVATPLGTVDALRLRVMTQYDDEEFWRLPSIGDGTVWYSPSVRGVVREETDVRYVERGLGEGPAEVRTHHLILELTAFVPGAR